MNARIFLPLAMGVALGSGFAQCFKMGEVDSARPDGQLLQQIVRENDETKKLALLEKFAGEYPKSDAAGWVYEQLQALYVKADSPDKVIETGGRIYALSPACPEPAHQALKAAEAKKDPELIKKWSGLTSQAALKMANSEKPQQADEVEQWKNRVDYARQVAQYADYSLYAAAIANPDPSKKVELFEALEQRSPKSEYLAKGAVQYFTALRQTKAEDKAIALAERMIAAGQPDEDMLLVVAFDHLQKKRDPAKVHAYSAKIVEILAVKPKPEGVADADWLKHKNAMLGLAHYLSGSTYFAQKQFPQADKELREALPKVDASLKPEVLFNLGVSNYQMKKAQEAFNFFRECAAIKSRYQEIANKNLAGIKREYTGIR